MNKTIKEIRGYYSIDPYEKYAAASYYVVYDDDTTARFKYEDNNSNFPLCDFSSVIVDDSSQFINGFKIVKLKNGKYSYVNELTGSLAPFNYDIVSDFNEYGFAMVGRAGRVTWINKNFDLLTPDGEMVSDIESIYNDKILGFDKIDKFSDGVIPLSRCTDRLQRYDVSYYFTCDGKLKKFYQFDGISKPQKGITKIVDGEIFDSNGHARMKNGILFAQGYYSTYDDLINLCINEGFMDEIDNRLDKSLGRVKSIK